MSYGGNLQEFDKGIWGKLNATKQEIFVGVTGAIMGVAGLYGIAARVLFDVGSGRLSPILDVGMMMAAVGCLYYSTRKMRNYRKIGSQNRPGF